MVVEKDTEKEERIKIIGKIIEARIKANPERDSYWYGQEFDTLYDYEIGTLRNLLVIVSKHL